ncbi:Protein H35B03.2 a [Aphelenchoides avenae]|nr:Protein H35B03.2 a [Aphelenchus avenae]
MHRFQFAELNLRHTGNAERTLNLVKRAIRMGYDSVAINVDVGDFLQDRVNPDKEESLPPKKKKKKKSTAAEAESEQPQPVDVIPDPFRVDETQLDLSSLEVAGKKFRQFSRLTVTLSDSTSVHRLLHHPKLRLYDIVAVRCPDEQIMSTLSRKGDFIDIVTYDPAQGKVPWMFKQKIVQACVAEGISFEVCYGQALTDSEHRRQFLTNARLLMRITRGGRGVIITSGAESLISIRAPYDTANLCTLFGLNPRDGRKFVAANAKQLLLRSQSRKTIKGAIHVADLEHVPSSSKTSAEALADLAAIPEFQAQMKPKEDEAEKMEEETGALQIFA